MEADTLTTEIFLSPAPGLQPAPLFTPTPKAAKRVLEFFAAQADNECLNGEIFYSLREAQVVIEKWRVVYNTLRPHSALGYRPPAPAAFAPQMAALRSPTAPCEPPFASLPDEVVM